MILRLKCGPGDRHEGRGQTGVFARAALVDVANRALGRRGHVLCSIRFSMAPGVHVSIFARQVAPVDTSVV
jgi:hypothetical protein